GAISPARGGGAACRERQIWTTQPVQRQRSAGPHRRQRCPWIHEQTPERPCAGRIRPLPLPGIVTSRDGFLPANPDGGPRGSLPPDPAGALNVIGPSSRDPAAEGPFPMRVGRVLRL